MWYQFAGVSCWTGACRRPAGPLQKPFPDPDAPLRNSPDLLAPKRINSTAGSGNSLATISRSYTSFLILFVPPTLHFLSHPHFLFFCPVTYQPGEEFTWNFIFSSSHLTSPLPFPLSLLLTEFSSSELVTHMFSLLCLYSPSHMSPSIASSIRKSTGGDSLREIIAYSF